MFVFDLKLHSKKNDSYSNAILVGCRHDDLPSPDEIKFLTESETRQYNGYEFKKRKDDFLLGRFGAKVALSRFTGISDVLKFEIRSGIFNQPVVRSSSIEPLFLSLSHSNGQSFALVCDLVNPICIDCESIVEIAINTIVATLGPLEKELTSSFSDRLDSAVLPIVIWTLRESLGKALNCGLSVKNGVLEVAKLSSFSDSILKSEYLNFSHYRGISLTNKSMILSLSVPRDIEVVDLSAFQIGLRSYLAP